MKGRCDLLADKVFSMKLYTLSYAKKRLVVFHLQERNKALGMRKVFKDVFIDSKRIVKWWSKNPNYNICIATGGVSNGLLFIYLDTS